MGSNVSFLEDEKGDEAHDKEDIHSKQDKQESIEQWTTDADTDLPCCSTTLSEYIQPNPIPSVSSKGEFTFNNQSLIHFICTIVPFLYIHECMPSIMIMQGVKHS